MKLRVIDNEHFSCQTCAQCCHNWHVELSPDEIARIQNLKWPAGDPLTTVNGFLRHSGRTYLAHAEDRGCVFLNRGNKLCRIHETFGEATKPLGCRLYPFQITPTFAGEAMITARFNCPTVRKNIGAPHANELPALKALLPLMTLPDGLKPADLGGFSREQVETVAEFLATLLSGFEGDRAKALFLFHTARVLAGTEPAELDRAALARSFPTLKAQVEALANPASLIVRPGPLQRMVFRVLLAQYLRRDEDIVDGRAGRPGRVIAMTSTILGFGSFHALGLIHPRGSLKKTQLFRQTLQVEAGAFDLLWRVVRLKLDALQFLGPPAGRRDFVEGLRSLALLYPLTHAFAKYHAVARGARQIESADVFPAVAAIDHAFGRSRVLNQQHARTMEELLLRPETFPALIIHM